MSVEAFMKVIGSFLVGFFVFLGSPINAQESTSSVDEQIEELEDALKPRDQLISELKNAQNALRTLRKSHNAEESTSLSVSEKEKIEREERVRLIKEFEEGLSVYDSLIEVLERMYRESGEKYEIEIYFDFRDAPGFTGRSRGDRLLGAERNWEFHLIRGYIKENFSFKQNHIGNDSYDSRVFSIFSLGGERILGKEGGVMRQNVMEHGLPDGVFTLALVETDTFGADDFYFIDIFRFNESTVTLGNYSYIKISRVDED